MCRERGEIAPLGGGVCAGVHAESASQEAEELALDGVSRLVLEEALQRDPEAFASTATKLTLVSVVQVIAKWNDSAYSLLTRPTRKGSAIRILAVLED
jgi:hypothetical protein